MALALTTITNSIAALSVSGVTLKDIDEIPETATGLGPVIYPKPDGFVTDFTVERNSFGGGSTAKMTATYNLTYRFCHSPVGSGRFLEFYDDMVTKAFLFLDAVIAVDVMTGLIDLQVDDTLSFGPVMDPSGAVFHGCDIVLRVMEFIN